MNEEENNKQKKKCQSRQAFFCDFFLLVCLLPMNSASSILFALHECAFLCVFSERFQAETVSACVCVSLFPVQSINKFYLVNNNYKKQDSTTTTIALTNSITNIKETK